MARGNRTYKRDANGRFASTGGGGKRSRPAAKRVERGPNKLTRDNSGKITSVGGNGATARGGRLRTASGNLRATQTTRIAGGRAGMVGKGGKLKGSKVLPTTRLTDNSRVPASQRPGSMTNTLRGVMGSLAKQDAKRIREVEAITGQKVRATRSNVGTAASNRVKATGAGSKSVSQTLRAGLRELAQSDARTMRGMAEIVRNSTPKLPGGKKAVGAGKAKALGPAKPKRTRPPVGQRIEQFKAKLNSRATAVADELRKVNNARNRDNSTSITPKYQKLMQRSAKAERAARSVQRAAKAVKKIELATNPAKFGYAKGSQQRKELAAQIRQQRRTIKYAKKIEASAKNVYQNTPLVKYGLTSEIGGNRRQSKKAKGRDSARQGRIADDYISARITRRQEQNKLGELRAKAKAQTAKTLAASKRTRP